MISSLKALVNLFLRYKGVWQICREYVNTSWLRVLPMNCVLQVAKPEWLQQGQYVLPSQFVKRSRQAHSSVFRRWLPARSASLTWSTVRATHNKLVLNEHFTLNSGRSEVSDAGQHCTETCSSRPGFWSVTIDPHQMFQFLAFMSCMNRNLQFILFIQ
mgnify:CR=1 FL=1